MSAVIGPQLAWSRRRALAVRLAFCTGGGGGGGSMVVLWLPPPPQPNQPTEAARTNIKRRFTGESPKWRVSEIPPPNPEKQLKLLLLTGHVAVYGIQNKKYVAHLGSVAQLRRGSC